MKKLLLSLLVLTGLNTYAAQDQVNTLELTDLGIEILVDKNDLTLYTFDVDPEGESNCSGQCLIVWPPLLVAADTIVEDPYELLNKKDGTTQLMHTGRPLYTFFGDKEVGDIKGDNLNGVWHIIETK
jgi:predicted lipoprotein with Yx(FWY)xxD motif